MLIPYTFAKRFGVLLQTEKNNDLTLIYRDNLSLTLVNEMRRSLNQTFTLKKVSSDIFQDLLSVCR